MRLPGTRYQEHGWEQVRKLLGQCSLQACAPALLETLAAGADADLLAGCLDDYIARCGAALRVAGRQPRACADGNSYGDSVQELALSLLCELHARPADWQAFASAVALDAARLGPFWRHGGGEAILRKKFNDMYAVLRDKVDSDNYTVACGRPCSANRIYAYRMLDTAYADIARLFDSWRELPEQVGAILGRAVSVAAAPIEVRQMKSIGHCQAAWVIAWSASRERFTGSPGPLHTRSKRFASLKHSEEKIAAMLEEIGEYEALSAHCEGDWQQDGADATAWLDDLARVLEQSETGERDADGAVADALSLPPSYLAMARLAEDAADWAARAMAACSLPVRLAVYVKLLGARDDCYPAEWLDPLTGELPTMQQLAALDGISLPTLRKRRDGAIAALQGGDATAQQRDGNDEHEQRLAS